MLRKPVLSCIRWKCPQRRDVRGLPKLSFRESFCWRTSDDRSRTSMTVLFTTKAIKRSDDKTSSRGSEVSVCLVTVPGVFFFLAIFVSRSPLSARERLLLLLESVTSRTGNSSLWKTSFLGEEQDGDR